MSMLKSAKVIRKLAELTEDGRLKWMETNGKTAFQTSLRTSSVVIDRAESLRSPDEYDFKIYFLNGEGTVVEDVSDEDLSQHIDNVYRILVNMYDTARSQALGVEDTLDEMLSDLNELSH